MVLILASDLQTGVSCVSHNNNSLIALLIQMYRRYTIFPGSKPIPVKPIAAETNDLVPVYSGEPWQSFIKHWNVGLKHKVTVVSEQKQPDCLLTVRMREPSEQVLAAARQIKGDRLLPIRELFTSENGIYIVSPYCEVSLESINACPAYPNNAQLALLASQVRSLHKLS